MKHNQVKLIANILLLVFYINMFSFAANPIMIEKADSPIGLIDLDNIISTNSISINNDKIVTEDNKSEDVNTSLNNVINEYAESIENAKKKAEYPLNYNLPTLLTQPEIHPNIDDYYGKDDDTIPICSVDVKDDEIKSNYISLTFDSAYINDYTYKILDTLDKYNFKCTFFMTHDFMKNNPEQVIEVVKRGHEVGNHSTTHPDLNTKTDQEVVSEIWRTHCYFKYLTGINMCLFRYPYGSYSKRTLKIVKMLGYYPIQWQVDSVDWKNISTSSIMNRLEGQKAYEAGNIILFHNGATYTPECLDDIIKIIIDKNLTVVRVTDLIYQHNFYLQSGKQKLIQTAIEE